MKIEIITTGDEVVGGAIVDTNSAWIAARCSDIGHQVIRHTSVADYLEDIGDVLQAAAGRADAVIVTGGLGPTADDLTIEAAARTFGKKLLRDEDVMSQMREFFKRIGRPMSASNDKQAMVPEGGIVLKNKVGTAPGIQVQLGNADFFFLPGVPKELYQIFDDSVMPWLKERAEGAIAERALRCFGMTEASIDEKLSGIDLGGVRLSFRVKFPEILLKVVARSTGGSAPQNVVDRAAKLIRDSLGEIVYGEGDRDIAQVVGDMLNERKFQISVAESCTGGLLADMITDVPGASSYFERGAVSYSNRSKQEMLGVGEEILREHGAVSRETATAMAEGIRNSSGSSIGVGITGIAGPSGGGPEKPVGTVHIAIATQSGTEAHAYCYNRERRGFKQLVAWTALDLVRRNLLRR